MIVFRTSDGGINGVTLVYLLQSPCYADPEGVADAGPDSGADQGNSYCNLPAAPGFSSNGGAYNFELSDLVLENAGAGIVFDGYDSALGGQPVVAGTNIPGQGSNLADSVIRRSTFQNLATWGTMFTGSGNAFVFLVADSTFSNVGGSGSHDGAIVSFSGSLTVIDNSFQNNNRDIYEANWEANQIRGNVSIGSNEFLVTQGNTPNDVSGTATRRRRTPPTGRTERGSPS